jgi:hypothetical protein
MIADRIGLAKPMPAGALKMIIPAVGNVQLANGFWETRQTNGNTGNLAGREVPVPIFLQPLRVQNSILYFCVIVRRMADVACSTPCMMK